MIFAISSELYISSSSLVFYLFSPFLTLHHITDPSAPHSSAPLASPPLCFLSYLILLVFSPLILFPLSFSFPSLPFLSSLLLFSRTLFLSPPHIRFVTPNHIQIDQLDLATVQEAITSQLGPDAIEVTHRHR